MGGTKNSERIVNLSETAVGDMAHDDIRLTLKCSFMYERSVGFPFERMKQVIIYFSVHKMDLSNEVHVFIVTNYTGRRVQGVLKAENKMEKWRWEKLVGDGDVEVLEERGTRRELERRKGR